MKTLVVILSLLLIKLAHAEPESSSRTLYDAQGRQTGRVEQRGNVQQFYDANGRSLGRSERRGDGVTNHYSNDGRMLGSSRERR